MGSWRQEETMILLVRSLIFTLYILYCGIVLQLLLKVAPVLTLPVQTCGGGDIKQLIVKVGETLNLPTGCNEPAGHRDQFIWSLLPENDVLVNYDSGQLYETPEPPPRWISELKERIILENDTGSLNIEDVCINDTHLYCGQVHKKARSSYFKFNVTVFDTVSTPHINASSVDDSCQSLTVQCSVENGRDVTLSWFRGEERLNQTSSPDLSTTLSLLLDIKDQDGDHSYNCKVENPVDEAVSELHIDQTCMRNKGKPADPDPHPDENIHPAIPWVIGVVCLCLCPLAAYFLFIHKCNIGEVNNQEGTRMQQTIWSWALRRVQGSAGKSGHQREQPEPGMPEPGKPLLPIKVSPGQVAEDGEGPM